MIVLSVVRWVNQEWLAGPPPNVGYPKSMVMAQPPLNGQYQLEQDVRPSHPFEARHLVDWKVRVSPTVEV